MRSVLHVRKGFSWTIKSVTTLSFFQLISALGTKKIAIIDVHGAHFFAKTVSIESSLEELLVFLIVVDSK